MKIFSDKIFVSTHGNNDIKNITEDVEKVIKKSGVKEGIVTVFVVGSTAGITTIEYEPGLIKDLPESLERIAPVNKRYYHDNTWNDGNGYAHIRSSIIGTSLTIPIGNGELESGTWQQIVLIDFDNRARQRNIICKIIGE
ncbi:MAG: secondary thiamine-phosphate synthase enzyme YjbQ [Bacteroidetes bacterium]|nr:secondary thiamine-phosphate synthase enzyme YjbQ [Bacteroidota bacterium]MBU1421911.1 secondary thiamine-phosphate synthase enzyme YjbQ [Bacteroidota bacterium]MBU2471602.1 secondary thiamine-phosphate synthase enzyme YjbQ [Bacteroidota bacterium]MBU2637146.1 secondary thiamine-phosphate synthase enzyme YjbQ [Bacteroidota bacterium]MDI6779182.1 secondary thiamine-phosphate synthase enzyme YjbQ [Bacteroidota bacterium]